MPIKTIHDLIHEPLRPLERVKAPKESAFSKKMFPMKPTIRRPSRSSAMEEVVPPLTRGDFLEKWREDRNELDKVRKENQKLKNIMNTTWSKDWKSVVNEK